MQQKNVKKDSYDIRLDREIKSLSDDELRWITEGSNQAFNDVSTIAELNGYPSPKNILEIQEVLDLTTPQKLALQSYYNTENEEAISQGVLFIENERSINQLFLNGSMTDEFLFDLTKKSDNIQTKIRFAHLRSHLKTLGVLNQDQLSMYYKAKGYDPCKFSPPGFDLKQWISENGCKNNIENSKLIN